MARVTVLIPTPLRQYTGKESQVALNGKTVGEVLKSLVTKYRDLQRHLYEDGRLRNFVNIFLNDEDIRFLRREATEIKDGDTLIIVPSIAGGAGPFKLTQMTRSAPYGLSPLELRRYGRHLIMPEVGLEGQLRLKSSSAVIVGAGGLGSPVLLYLAAAGVGRIGIVDFDLVEHSNLQRQIIHSTNSVGRPKLESAKERALSVNPEIQVEVHEIRLDSSNALEILKGYDVIVDGTDNFPTRYLVNDASVLLKKPNVYGSIFRFEGQASVFNAENGPCYRCLYPEPPPPGLVPSCAEGGVLGVLPGVIGSIQATEAIKLMLGRGDSLVGRLLLFDALGMTFRELKLRKDPNCPACGTNPTIRELIDYEEFCGISQQKQLENGWEVTAKELATEMAGGQRILLVDVREPHEYDICRIEGSALMPLGSLPNRLNELSTVDNIVVYCHTGVRSAQAVQFMKQMGYTRVRNLGGGIDAWSVDVDPSVPQY